MFPASLFFYSPFYRLTEIITDSISKNDFLFINSISNGLDL